MLRGLAFFSHAVGTAAFPGLVLADGLSFPAHLGALGTAAALAIGIALLARRDRERYDSLTALLLVAALAAGVILASDVFHSGANVETLLFGSLLAIRDGDIAWAAASRRRRPARDAGTRAALAGNRLRRRHGTGARRALAAPTTPSCSRSSR